MSVSRTIKKNRTKKKITGDVPAVVVYRSNKNVTGQLYDPQTGKTLCTVNSNSLTTGTKTEKAVAVGKKLASKIKDLKLSQVVFNRNGYEYKGRIRAFADAIREENIIM